jgi:hypothetical protein
MALITEDNLISAFQTLLEQDQLELLVQIAEKWKIKDTLPQRASIIESRAFIRLCLLELAWHRIKNVEHSKEKLEITVDVLIHRGWMSKARGALVQLQSEHPKHPRLEEYYRAVRNGVQPPRNAENIIQKGTPSQMVALAQKFLYYGKSQVGQKILHRALQIDPQNQSARRLLWALRGDFSTSLSLVQLWQQIQFDVKDVEPETTIATTSINQQLHLPNHESNFPNLFYGADNHNITEEISTDQTKRVIFSANPEQENTQVYDDETFGDKETQVLDVVVADASPNSVEFIAKKTNKSQETGDEEVIIFTEQESLTSELGHPPILLDEPIKVIEKHPTPLKVNSTVLPPVNEPNENIKPPNENTVKLIQAVIVSIIAMIIVASIVLLGIRHTAKNNLMGETVVPILSAKKQLLRKHVHQLETQVFNDVMPVDIRETYLAFSLFVYWRDFSRKESDYYKAIELMNGTDSNLIPWLYNSFQVLKYLDENNVIEAKRYLQLIDEENEITDWIRIEFLSAIGAKWPEDINPSLYPRLETLAIQHGILEPNLNSKHGWVLLVSLGRELSNVPTQQANEILEYIYVNRTNIGKPHLAKMVLLQSLVIEGNYMEVKKLRKKAYEYDSSNSDIQFWYGYDLFLSMEMTTAMQVWQQCYLERMACSSGYIFLAMELDKVNTASEAIQQLGDDHPLGVQLENYVNNLNKNTKSIDGLASFWSTEDPNIENIDIFWQEIFERKSNWMDGDNQENILYWAWKASHSFQNKKFKSAFRYASRVLNQNDQYVKMYRIAAHSARKLSNTENRGLWEIYLSKEPEGKRKEEAESALK